MECLNNVVGAADVVSLSGQRQLRVLGALNARSPNKNITGYQRDLMKMRADHATSLIYLLL